MIGANYGHNNHYTMINIGGDSDGCMMVIAAYGIDGRDDIVLGSWCY